MKLEQLQNVRSLPKLAQKNLVVTVNWMQVGLHGYFVISDVPPISDEQLHELFELSFEKRIISRMMDAQYPRALKAMRKFKTKWDDGSAMPRNPHQDIIKVTWKEFVAHITKADAQTPGGNDDFDE